MTTVVHVSMAAAGGDDIENAWAVYRAAEMCRYESWNLCASDINFEQLTRKEKLFFLRCWKFAVENGSFMRIFGGYNALFRNVCDPNSDILEFSQEMQKRFNDADLLPVVLEAYAEARHAAAVNWGAAASLYNENEYLKKRVAELEGEIATITTQRDLWYEKTQDLEAAGKKQGKAPDFKALARELVDNLVDCGGLDTSVKEQYLAFAEDACRKALTGGV